MNEIRIKVLEFELKAVRALRSASDKELVREALNREEELELQIATLRGGAELKLAANFARRDEDPGEDKTGGGR